MRLGRPSAASRSSGVAYCTGRLERYEYSPWSAMPAGPGRVEAQAEELDVLRDTPRSRSRCPCGKATRSAALPQIGVMSGPPVRTEVGVPLMPEKSGIAAVVVHVVQAELRVVEVGAGSASRGRTGRCRSGSWSAERGAQTEAAGSIRARRAPRPVGAERRDDRRHRVRRRRVLVAAAAERQDHARRVVGGEVVVREVGAARVDADLVVVGEVEALHARVLRELQVGPEARTWG